VDESRGVVVNARSAFEWSCLAWATLALAVVPYLLLRPAPYGRHSRNGWGPTLNARWAWVLMELPSPTLMTIYFLLADRRLVSVEGVFLGLWLFHYTYRAFAFPLLLPKSSRPMPVVVLASGAFFNLVNASLNGIGLFHRVPPRSPAWLVSPGFIIGVALFLIGFTIHVVADHQLRRLRQKNAGERGLPTGWIFERLSCPNYSGEILEWTGFALATWSPTGLLFAFWTAANLIPRAVHHHRWYCANFADYPTKRRAIVPFVL
jgi:3-oxo-5-alpha-steroid 4-dehydrogenase 1